MVGHPNFELLRMRKRVFLVKKKLSPNVELLRMREIVDETAPNEYSRPLSTASKLSKFRERPLAGALFFFDFLITRP